VKHSDARVKKSKQGWLYLALVVGADGFEWAGFFWERGGRRKGRGNMLLTPWGFPPLAQSNYRVSSLDPVVEFGFITKIKKYCCREDLIRASALLNGAPPSWVSNQEEHSV